MTNTPSENSRDYVKQALKRYASFFASLARGNEELAAECIEQIRATDLEAAEVLRQSDLKYYQSRKTYLMKIFREQLMVQLEGQIKHDLLERASILAKEIEIESI